MDESRSGCWELLGYDAVQSGYVVINVLRALKVDEIARSSEMRLFLYETARC
jgi:hypothetical protein